MSTSSTSEQNFSLGSTESSIGNLTGSRSGVATNNIDTHGFATLKVQNSNLDNRSLDNLNNARGLTPVESHPLMMQLSPTGSAKSNDSIEYGPTTNHHHSYNYPDVVPDTTTTNTISSRRAFSHNQAAAGNANEDELSDGGDIFTSCHSTSSTNVKPSSNSKANALTLDLVKNNEKKMGVRKKVPILQDANYSSGSEQDLSQYQATVGPTYDTVALVSQGPSKATVAKTLSTLQQRRISLDAELLGDGFNGGSSPDTGTPVENGKLSPSPCSSIFEDGIIPADRDDNDDDPTPGRDRSNWVKVTLPDGRTREIDMKVIEPYKRILSHGGYINKKNAIIVFSTCFLPDRSRSDYHYVMANLFLYVIRTLQQLITDDYVLIYFHGGSNKNNVPPFRWLKKCYQLIDRRLRKSLKTMYLVHPSFWLKSMVWMLRPFVSTKFWRKMIYVRSLSELYGLVDVERAAVPDKVRNYDLKHS